MRLNAYIASAYAYLAKHTANRLCSGQFQERKRHNNLFVSADWLVKKPPKEDEKKKEVKAHNAPKP